MVPTIVSLIRSRSEIFPWQTTAFATYSSELCSRSCSGATSSISPFRSFIATSSSVDPDDRE